jgi:hypothetical protein
MISRVRLGKGKHPTHPWVFGVLLSVTADILVQISGLTNGAGANDQHIHGLVEFT